MGGPTQRPFLGYPACAGLDLIAADCFWTGAGAVMRKAVRLARQRQGPDPLV
jgi:hypothetical protein